jgi:hypothetical protein
MNNELIRSDSGYSPRNLGYMKIFASEYPDFPFLQVPLAKLQELPNMQARLATQRSRPHVYKKN